MIRETPKAAQAFQDYLAMGAGRSLRKLAAVYVEHGYHKTASTAFTILKNWSIAHGWQDRLTEAINERSAALLAEASELDADSFLLTSRLLNQRLAYADPLHVDTVVKIRETVRSRATGVGGLTVNVAIYQQAEKLASKLGITADELIADAEAIAAEAWES